MKHSKGYSILIIVVVVCFCLLMLTFIFAMGLRMNMFLLNRKYMRSKCVTISEGAADYALYKLNEEGSVPKTVSFEDGNAEVSFVSADGETYRIESTSIIKENDKTYSETVWVDLVKEDDIYYISKIYYPSLSNYTGD